MLGEINAGLKLILFTPDISLGVSRGESSTGREGRKVFLRHFGHGDGLWEAEWTLCRSHLRLNSKVATQKNWKYEVPAISAYVTEISTINFTRGLYRLSSNCL